MFYDYSNLFSLNLSRFDTPRVKDMSWMFYNCSNLTNIYVSCFITSKVTNMEVMIAGCWRLTSLDLSNFETGKVINMAAMFATCKSLNHLILASQITLTEFSELQTVPAKGARIPITNKIVAELGLLLAVINKFSVILLRN